MQTTRYNFRIKHVWRYIAVLNFCNPTVTMISLFLFVMRVTATLSAPFKEHFMAVRSRETTTYTQR